VSLEESEARLEAIEARLRAQLRKLIEMDRRFKAYLLPPLPSEIISYIHTLGDLFTELDALVGAFQTYRKFLKEKLKG
jgi:septation ring formation regulator EzrA